MSYDDHNIMAQIAVGKKEAFHILVKRYTQKALFFANKILYNQSDAEDVVQEAFIKVWREAPNWQPKAAFSTWFYKVLYHLCIDVIRKRKPEENEVLDSIADEKLLPESQLQFEDMKILMNDFIKSLPEQQRVALALCYYQEYTAQQAADIMGVSLTAVEALLFRARRNLHKKLETISY